MSNPQEHVQTFVSVNQAQSLYLDACRQIKGLKCELNDFKANFEKQQSKMQYLSQEVWAIRSEYGDVRWRSLAVPFLGRTKDLDNFIAGVELVFHLHYSIFTGEEDKCLFVLFCMEGPACFIRQKMIESKALHSWAVFKDKLKTLVEECSSEVGNGMTLLDLRYVCSFASM